MPTLESPHAGPPAPTKNGASMPHSDAVNERLIEQGQRALQVEANAVQALVQRIGPEFAQACRLILACKGRVIVSGIGKSGHVARKIAATLASTGTPAYFVHPAEASHGDLGMVTADDVFMALSNSGSTEELMAIVPLVKRMGAQLIALTGKPDSPLAQLADAHLDTGVAQEACSLNLAPTASTTAALAMGDAIAVALLDARGFGADDFAMTHPGGALGRRLLTRVDDVMRRDGQLPKVSPDTSITQAMLEVSAKRMGMAAVVDTQDQLLGLFTDGDLRRLLQEQHSLQGAISSVMTTKPATIGAQALAAQALSLMEERRISQLPVIDSAGRLVGALHLHDLLTAKIA
jgi:arabinose-5-phosphate isomerase